MRDIGRNIRDLREQNNLTQEELADKLFVTRQTVSNYEHGKTRPDVDMIMKIADVLNVDANAVFYGIPVPENRKTAFRRLTVSSTVLLVMVIGAIILHPLCRSLQAEKYITTPSFLMSMFYDPILMLVLGWWIMQGIGIVLKSKGLKKPWTKKARRTVMMILLLCFVLELPYAIWYVVVWIKLVAAGSVQMKFPYIPVYQEIVYSIILGSIRCPAVYALFGGLLWLFGFPQTREVAETDEHR
ncbi:MAG: helix-turn-helix transcriptional regulator [Oscillibacter sp.]|nr:helix-turn-helix transcriptional regulator [Oscillibacter sp.]